MKFLWSVTVGTAFLILVLDYTIGQTPETNKSRKLDLGTGSKPPLFGSTFDEIVVQSSLSIRGKSPSSRSGRTQLFPVKANNTNVTPNSNSTKL